MHKLVKQLAEHTLHRGTCMIPSTPFTVAPACPPARPLSWHMHALYVLSLSLSTTRTTSHRTIFPSPWHLHVPGIGHVRAHTVAHSHARFRADGHDRIACRGAAASFLCPHPEDVQWASPVGVTPAPRHRRHTHPLTRSHGHRCTRAARRGNVVLDPRAQTATGTAVLLWARPCQPYIYMRLACCCCLRGCLRGCDYMASLISLVALVTLEYRSRDECTPRGKKSGRRDAETKGGQNDDPNEVHILLFDASDAPEIYNIHVRGKQPST